MNKLLIILIALFSSQMALSNSVSENKKQLFEFSILLEPIINKCSEKFGSEYKSSYSTWANNNIVHIMEGMELVLKELGKNTDIEALMQKYQPKIDNLNKELSKESDKSLKEKCDSTLKILNQ